MIRRLPAVAWTAAALCIVPAVVSGESRAIPFSDITAEAGIRFVHENGARGEKLLPETMGGGAAFFDYDEDGDPDLFLANSTAWPPEDPATVSALYRNEGRNRFVDVTRAAGLADPIYAQGVATGDADGDGWTDLFLTAVGPNRLYRNVAGVFQDATAAAGVAGSADAWSTCAAFVDADGDRDLDLFVCNYLEWSAEADRELDHRLPNGTRGYAPPTLLPGAHPFFYRNRGGGVFEEASAEVGLRAEDPVSGEPLAKALGVLPIDLDGDRRPDLVVANDTTRNLLFRNRGGGIFEETGELSGIAWDAEGRTTGAMGVDAGTLGTDDEISLVIGNYANEVTSLYRGAEEGEFFTDEALGAGLGTGTRSTLTFGLLLFDADLDGAIDLFQANGHVEPDIATADPAQSYRQPPHLFRNDGRGRFELLSDERVGELSRPLAGRGATHADTDRDGDIDLVVTQVGAPALLLRNELVSENRWLRVRLAEPGDAAAYGARVDLSTRGRSQSREIRPTRSYLSQVEPSASFGLGPEPGALELTVTWPDGQRRRFRSAPPDREITILPILTTGS